jgi:glycosyltransferase involved in cell wall biosynthesis
VVDQNDPLALVAAMKSILTDAELRRKLGENARKAAEDDFSLKAAQSVFMELLQRKG